MKIKYSPINCLTALAVASLMAVSASGATRTWDGGGGDDNWLTPGNWDGDLTPPAAGDALLLAGTTRLTPNNNFGVGTNFAGITFSNNAGAFTLSGDAIALTGSVVDNSTDTQTISLGLALGTAARTFTVSSNAGTIILNGPISASSTSGSVTKNGPGTLKVNGIWSNANVGMAANAGNLYFANGANVTARIVNLGGVANSPSSLVIESGVTLSASGGTWSLGSASNSGTNTYTQTGGSISCGSLTTANSAGTATLMSISGGSLTMSGTLTHGSRGIQAAQTAGILNLSNSGLITCAMFQFGDGANFGVSGDVINNIITITNTAELRVTTTSFDWGRCGATAAGTRINTINLDGGMLSTVATKVSSPSLVTSTLKFNGGTLQARGTSANFLNGLNSAVVKAGGARIDTQTYNITIGQGLAEDSGSTGGGLTKLGSGMLTLNGGSSYTGTTTISNGVLALGAGSSLSSSLVALRDGTGLQIAPGSATTLSLNALTIGGSSSGAAVDFGFGSGVNDTLNITSAGGLTLNGGTLYLYNEGTTLPFSSPGTYMLFQYNTSFAGPLSALSIGNPQPGKIYSLSNDVAAAQIVLQISLDPSANQWNVDADGNWSVATNWSVGVPNSAGASATFGGAITTPRVVTVDTASTLGRMTFDNISSGYTIAGAAVLTLDNGANSGLISIASGSHAISAPLLLVSNVLMSPSAGTSLTLAGDISGAGKALIVTNGGTVALIGTNYCLTSIKAGTLAIADESNLGPDPGSFNANQLLIDGGVLRTTASFALDDTNRGVNLGANNATFSTDASTILTMANPLTGAGGLIKAGGGNLELIASNSYSGNTTINAGALQLGNGLANGSVGGGDIFMNGGALAFNITNPLIFLKKITRTSGTPQIANWSTNPVTLSVGIEANSGSMGFNPDLGDISVGTISNLTGLNKVGASALVMTGTNVLNTSGNGAVNLQRGRLAFASGSSCTINGGRACMWTVVTPYGEQCEMFISNGASVAVSSLFTGGPNSAGNSSVTVDGGSLALGIVANDAFDLHDGSGFYTDTLTVNSGSMNVLSPDARVNIGVRGDASINVNGGTVNFTRAGFGYIQSDLSGAAQANCFFNVSNGILSVTTQFDSMRDPAATVDRVNTINLAGGALRTVAMNCSSPAATVNLNFNGGTLVALGNAAYAGSDGLGNVTNFLKGVDNANVQAGGALIDSGGYDIVITNNLVEDPASTGGGLRKLGAGRLTLGGVYSYTGPTTVSNGTLSVSGSLTGTGAVTVKSGATLGGTGAVAGATTVEAGGTLSPGASIGQLTCNGNLALNAGAAALFEVNVANLPATNDYVAVSGALSATGATLTVTNTGPALVAGDSFKLFNQPVSGFATVNLPAGYNWTNKLAFDGSIQVLSVIVIAPPNFPPGAVTRLPDGNISLTGTGTIGATYKLWAGTNVASTPITNTWTLLSSGTISVSPFTISDLTATNYPQRFYMFSAP